MNRCLLACASFFFFIFVFCGAAFAAEGDGADVTPFDPLVHDWPHDVAGAAPDPRFQFGRLPNGMRYIIVPSDDETGRLSVRLRFDVGSNDEPEDKYGIAHMLEHMAFKGSRDIAPEDMVYQMQELGMNMGPDINAYTADKFTFYMFDFPDASKKNLKLGLHFLSQVAQHLTLTDKALKTERDVVIAENLLRDTKVSAAQRAKFLFYYPENERLRAPIGGSEKTLNTITALDLRRYYEAHYHPDNALLIVLGGVNPAYVHRQIEAKFSSWPRQAAKPQSRAKPDITRLSYKDADLFEGEDVLFSFSITENRETQSDVTSETILDQHFAQNVAQDMFRARLDRRSDQYEKINWINPVFYRRPGGDVSSVAFGVYENVTGLNVFDRERRYVLQAGFSEAELQRALTKRRSGLISQVKKGDDINAPLLATKIMTSFGDGQVLQSPQQKLARFRRLAPALKSKDYDAAFAYMWGDYKPRFWLQGDGVERSELREAQKGLEKSRGEKLKPRKAEKLPEFRVKGLSVPGQVINTETLAGTGITRVKFANGVYLNYRQMEREQSDLQIDVQLRSDFTKLSPRFASHAAMLSAMRAADIKGYSKSELEDLFGGKKYDFRSHISSQSLSFWLNPDRQDLETSLLVLAGFLSGFDDESEHWRHAYLAKHSTIKTYINTSPVFYGQYYLDHFLSGEQSMFKDVPRVKIKPEAVAGLRHYFENGVIEIGVTGDFDPDVLVEKVRVTLGALPPRPTAFPANITDFENARITPELEQTFFYSGDDKQMALFYCWSVPNQPDTARKSKTSLALQIVKNETDKALRYDNGLVYSPEVMMRDSLQFPDFRFQCILFQIDPENELRVRKTMQALFKRLANGDIDSKDFERARKPHEVDSKKRRESSARMSGIVARAASDEKWVRDMFGLEAWYQSVKFEDVKAHMKEIFGDPSPHLIRIQSYESPWDLEFRTNEIKAELGDPAAQLALAQIYRLDVYRVDDENKEDPEKEIFWLQKAVAQNNHQAQYEAGKYYARDGAAKDLKKAVGYFQSAAKGNHAQAAYDLAQIYFRNKRLYPDITNPEMMALFKQSAEGGSSSGQEAYAQRFLDGAMVPRDRDAALMWAYASREFGNLTMRNKKLARFTNGMSEAAQKAAQERAKAFKEKFDKDHN